jgi:hypothetical protein
VLNVSEGLKDKGKLVHDLLEVLFQLTVGNNQGSIKNHPWKNPFLAKNSYYLLHPAGHSIILCSATYVF